MCTACCIVTALQIWFLFDRVCFICRLRELARRHFLPFLFVLPRSSTRFAFPCTRTSMSITPLRVRLVVCRFYFYCCLQEQRLRDEQRCILHTNCCLCSSVYLCSLLHQKKGGGAKRIFCVAKSESDFPLLFTCRRCDSCFQTRLQLLFFML